MYFLPTIFKFWRSFIKIILFSTFKVTKMYSQHERHSADSNNVSYRMEKKQRNSLRGLWMDNIFENCLETLKCSDTRTTLHNRLNEIFY